MFLLVGWHFDHAAVNIFSHARLLFPDYVIFTDNMIRLIILIAAALPGEPLGDGEVCLATIIAHVVGFLPHGNRLPQFTLWRVDGVALDQRHLAQGFDIEGTELEERLILEDVVYQDGLFYFVTNQQDMVAVHVGIEGQVLVAHQHIIKCQQAADPQDLQRQVIARYMVMSRGELCMVVRYTRDDAHVPRQWR